MRKLSSIILCAALAAIAFTTVSCDPKETAKNYKLTVVSVLPDDITVSDIQEITTEVVKDAVPTTITMVASGSGFTGSSELPQGNYSVTVSGKTTDGKKSVVGTVDIALYEDMTAEIKLESVATSPLVFKTIYPTTGKQFYIVGCDSYVEIVNNSDEVQYLDQIILYAGNGGQSQPNAWQANGYENLYGGGDQGPVIAFPGNGTDFPLQPGKSVVVANNPKNHKDMGEGYENCADLSKADWDIYLAHRANDVDYEGIPNMEIVYKGPYGTMNAWGPFLGKGAFALIKLPAGMTPAEFAAKDENYMTTPGTESSARFLVFPSEYVLDAVDVWDVTGETHYPTFLATDDAQGVMGVESYSGKCVRRKVVKIENGRCYFKDTNNSSKDFLSDQPLTPGVDPTAVDAE